MPYIHNTLVDDIFVNVCVVACCVALCCVALCCVVLRVVLWCCVVARCVVILCMLCLLSVNFWGRPSDVGKPKAEVIASWISRRRPMCKVVS